MTNMLTAAAQILWTQRIEKELKVNGRSPAGFSLRNCVSVADVPAKFKPGHVDPSHGGRELEFDPATIGWDPKSTTAKEFRRCINAQQAGPRERHQFPETAQQEIGWCQAHCGEVALRSGPAGSQPTKLGIGWLGKDGHGGVLAAAVGEVKEEAARVSEPERRKTTYRNPREEFGVPPFSTTSGAQERAAARKALKEPTSVLGGAGAASSCGGGRSVLRPSAPQSLLSATAPTALSKASSLPALSANPNKHLAYQEQNVDKLLQQSRRYLNRHRSNVNYHPLSNSDVATFADAYTKAFGTCIFHKS